MEFSLENLEQAPKRVKVLSFFKKTFTSKPQVFGFELKVFSPEPKILGLKPKNCFPLKRGDEKSLHSLVGQAMVISTFSPSQKQLSSQFLNYFC